MPIDDWDGDEDTTFTRQFAWTGAFILWTIVLSAIVLWLRLQGPEPIDAEKVIYQMRGNSNTWTEIWCTSPSFPDQWPARADGKCYAEDAWRVTREP